MAIGTWLADHRVASAEWLLDRPISNSGRLRKLMLSLANEHDFPWSVELVANPDLPLSASKEIVATADSAILDRCESWLSLARSVVEDSVPDAWIIRP